jgi:hypothetical protein
LNPAWKKFWPFASATAAAALMALPLIASGGSKLVTEKSLAGLRPGKDSLQTAIHRFGRAATQSDSGLAVWSDPCNHVLLEVNSSAGGVIQGATAELGPGGTADCVAKAFTRKRRARWGSGRGLIVGDGCERIEQTYGTPQSKAASGESGKQLESYAYTFESNSKSTLRLEVSCDLSSDTVSKLRLETVGASAQ